MKIQIGSETFKSKKSACDFVRDKINSIGCCSITDNDDEFSFFMSLLNNHPEVDEKIGTGIKCFMIQRHPMFGNQLLIERKDKTNDVISWKACCGVKHSEKYYVSIKCRDAVVSEVYNFKKDKKCEQCGNTNELHTHHSTVSFKTIVEDFIKIYGMNECSKFIRNEHNIPCFAQDMKDKFISYHNSVCQLQVLCHNCHNDIHAQSH